MFSWMVDEASMIANLGLGGTTFGSGCLLDDLIHFVYQGRNDRLLLIGDKAQLPPVGEEESPALSAAMLQGYGLSVYECDLNEVVRQSQQSGILFNATRIRHKKRISIEIIIEIELAIHSGKRLFAIDAAMNGIGRHPAVQREDLSRPTRRSKEHHLLANGTERTDDSTRKRCLTGTRTTPENHHSMRIAIRHKLHENIERLSLFWGWRKAKLL
jgi:hypothetical protein